ncbi:FHA domain-containing protein [Lyngbya confervoides]|uniref:FHA domain-containing protein n=1 Tax=Lyngbya confervoides BDU141951 TaxID=1574623 RepID=A0ABD4T345_9CYAN|nr:FHA domain-containing protein [Lyngbya confervoides]MCM1983041.1 FHA domain-containing protein [Lyngbya confervoides BDU141951]
MVNELNLEWIEAGSLKTQNFVPGQPGPQPDTLRIGRDPSRCDIVLSDGSVSGLHVEIGFESSSGRFYVQNLRPTNPAIVNGESLTQGMIYLLPENTIQLGNVQIRAIATVPLPDQAVPPTELQHWGYAPAPGPVSPPTPVYTPPPGYGVGAPAQSPLPYNPPPNYQGIPLPPPVTGSPPGSQNRSKPWVFVLVGVVVLGLVGLVGSNIQRFFGLANRDNSSGEVQREDSSSPSSSGPAEGPLGISNLVPFEHPSGLFSINVPDNWQDIDNSEAGEIVIRGWRHPDIYSFVIARIFAADRAVSLDELQNFSVEHVEALFEDLDQFRRNNPDRLLDGSIRITWQYLEAGDVLKAATFVRQDGLNVSSLTIAIPEEFANSDSEFQISIHAIVDSFEVDPDVTIP